MNDAAAALGLRPAMALADARAKYPALDAVDGDLDEDRRILEAIADWCDRYTPLVGLDGTDGLLLDVAGCAHLFGGEAAMGRDLLRRLEAQGFRARVAVADTVGCAWAVARFGRDAIVESGQERGALLPLPLAALRLAPDIVLALARTGLKRIADVIDQPRAPLAARFQGLVRRIDQALGREDESITPRLPLPSYLAERRFVDPIAREEDVLGTIETLARELGRILERQGEGARTLQAALFRTDGKVYRIDVGASAPVRDAARIRRLFVERLAAIGDACDPGFGYDVVRLSVLAAERSEPAQTDFVAKDHAEDLAHLIDRLGARFGLRRVTRLVEYDTHIPEFAVVAVAASGMRAFSGRVPARRDAKRSALPSPLRGGSPRSGGVGGTSEFQSHHPHPQPLPAAKSDVSDLANLTKPERGNTRVPVGRGANRASLTAYDNFIQDNPAQDSHFQHSNAPVRPIRLFAHPEPVEAVAEVPDGPPVRFRWRRLLLEVAAVEGPERIAMEWWRDAQGRVLARDYFRVESREGLRIWLYREGEFTTTRQPGWFVHGIFA